MKLLDFEPGTCVCQLRWPYTSASAKLYIKSMRYNRTMFGTSSTFPSMHACPLLGTHDTHAHKHPSDGGIAMLSGHPGVTQRRDQRTNASKHSALHTLDGTRCGGVTPSFVHLQTHSVQIMEQHTHTHAHTHAHTDAPVNSVDSVEWATQRTRCFSGAPRHTNA